MLKGRKNQERILSILTFPVENCSGPLVSRDKKQGDLINYFSLQGQLGALKNKYWEFMCVEIRMKGRQSTQQQWILTVFSAQTCQVWPQPYQTHTPKRSKWKYLGSISGIKTMETRLFRHRKPLSHLSLGIWRKLELWEKLAFKLYLTRVNERGTKY